MADPVLAIEGAFGAAHLWTPTDPPHPGLRGDSFMRSKCGRVASVDRLMRVSGRDDHKCGKCHCEGGSNA